MHKLHDIEVKPLTIGPAGRMWGIPEMTHNDPWPCPNGTPNRTGKMRGALVHTMVGSLSGTKRAFNTPSFQASAHFGVGQSEDEGCHQFGPILHGWEAWHAMAANLEWYGIEEADAGNPNTPYTCYQIVRTGQIVECLSHYADFPLRITDSTEGHGIGTHAMGRQAWGGHTCPDVPPRHVRSQQRPQILTVADQVRALR